MQLSTPPHPADKMRDANNIVLDDMLFVSISILISVAIIRFFSELRRASPANRSRMRAAAWSFLSDADRDDWLRAAKSDRHSK
jgi:hypothetical protein